MAGALKKGMLCLAFGAAVASMAGCDNAKKPAPAATKTAVTFQGLPDATPHLKSAASQAALLQIDEAVQDRLLKDKKITQAEHDESVKNDDYHIRILRGQYTSKPEASVFDAYFKSELKQRGFPVPDKVPGSELDKKAPTTAPAPKR
jgi:hypothetical protein